jgi:hypothetical protein
MQRLGVVAIVLLALAWIPVMQLPGANQNAHLALVKSLAAGTPRIDRFRTETADTAYVDGHYYTAKAPGLALVTLPWYMALDGLGLTVENPAAERPWPEAMYAMPRPAIWEVSLFGALLPAFVLLLIVGSLVDRLIPGYGTVAAVTVGAGSLLGLFATFFFAHALSACLGFAAFALLVFEWHRRWRWPGTIVLAGALAGLATVVELPLAIVATAAFLYAIARPYQRVPRALGFGTGFMIGVLPLLAFDAWAFGSPFRVPYSNAVLEPGVSGHDVVGANAGGFFGVGAPKLHSGLELLLSGTGLIVVAPVWALTGFGLVVLWRQGLRSEAAVVGAVAGAFVVYNAAYWLPFGGFSAGPRFLVPLLPFLALPIAAAFRSLPLTSLALALAAIVVTTVSLLAEPLDHAEDAGTWFHRLGRGDVTQTLFRWQLDMSGIAGVIPVALFIASAVGLAVYVTPWPGLRFREAILACAALGAWRIVYVGAPTLLEVDRAHQGWTGVAAVIGLLAAIAVFLVLLSRTGLIAIVPAIALVPLVWPRFAAHTTASLVAVSVALLGLGTLAWYQSATANGRVPL